MTLLLGLETLCHSVHPGSPSGVVSTVTAPHFPDVCV